MNQKKKSSRTYTTGTMAALNHPMRITLYDLIKQGAKTTPELATILNENRINLYHHLSKLEETGLIESYYGNDRIKKYRIKDLKNNFEESQKALIQEIKLSEGDQSMKTQTLVVTPPEGQQGEFTKKAKELLKMSNITLNKHMDIVQILVLYQPKQVTKLYKKQLNQMRKSRK